MLYYFIDSNIFKQYNKDISLVEFLFPPFARPVSRLPLLVLGGCLVTSLARPLLVEDTRLVARHRTEPGLVARTQGGGEQRQRRRIVVRTKTPLSSSDLFRPKLDFLANGAPAAGVAGRQQLLVTTAAAPATTTASSSNSTAAALSPLSWLTRVFPFNGLPTNIFSLSPMSLLSESLFSNVVTHGDMGPHVLL